VSDLFSNVIDAARSSFRHLGNGDFTVLMIVAGAVVLVGILIFRR
jgi:hypothetical protein